MYAAVDDGFRWTPGAGITVPPFEDDVLADEILGEIRSPKKLEHRAGESAVGPTGDPALAGGGEFTGEGRLEVLKRCEASAWIATVDDRSDQIGEGSEAAKAELADEPRGGGEAGEFEPVAEGMVHGRRGKM